MSRILGRLCVPVFWTGVRQVRVVMASDACFGQVMRTVVKGQCHAVRIAFISTREGLIAAFRGERLEQCLFCNSRRVPGISRES
jgi:hypothetical protein